METFELILFLLTAVIASSILDKFLPPLSLPLVQIALGAALALAVPTPLEWGIDPELLLILFIAPLHFNESRHVDSGACGKTAGASRRFPWGSSSPSLLPAGRRCTRFCPPCPWRLPARSAAPWDLPMPWPSRR